MSVVMVARASSYCSPRRLRDSPKLWRADRPSLHVLYSKSDSWISKGFPGNFLQSSQDKS